MQWLSLLLSFLIGKSNFSRTPSLRDSVSFLFEEAGKRSRKPVLMILGGLTCVLILCGGFFMGLIDVTTQADRNGIVQPTASATTGFALALIAGATFAWIFTRAWPGIKQAKEIKAEVKEHKASSLEQALTLLVMDFVKEREAKREERHQQPHRTPPPPVSEREPSPPLHH